MLGPLPGAKGTVIERSGLCYQKPSVWWGRSLRNGVPRKWWEYAEGAMGIQKDCVWTKGQTRCWWAYHLQVKYYNGKYRYCLVSWQSKMRQLRYYYLEKSIWMLFFFCLLFSLFSPTILSHGFCILFPEETAPAKKKKQKNKKTKKKIKNSVELVGFLSFCYYLFIRGCAGCSLLCAGYL